MEKKDSFFNGVLVPFMQSVITGLLVGICAGVLTACFNYPQSARVGIVLGCIVALVGWFSYRSHWQQIIDILLGVDYYMNEEKPEEQLTGERVAPMRVELLEEGGMVGNFINLPYPEKIPYLAAGLQQGKTFAQSVWTGQGALFSRNEFETIRAELLKRGLARWRKEGAPGQGVHLTPAGRAVFKRLAEQNPTLPGGISRV